LPALLPRTRTLLTTRRRWRKRVSVRRRASGRAHYNYFRDYDPAVGKYTESDPIGLEGGLSTYAFVSSAPIDLIDPTGLQEFDPGQVQDPFPGKRGPAGGGRDRRTPFTPKNQGKNGNCAPYWSVTWFNGGDAERKSLVPLVREKKLFETDCFVAVECTYKGWIVTSADWSDRPRFRYFPFSTTFYKEVPKKGGKCGCANN
jgi:RHS repeat-associated protein